MRGIEIGRRAQPVEIARRAGPHAGGDHVERGAPQPDRARERHEIVVDVAQRQIVDGHFGRHSQTHRIAVGRRLQHVLFADVGIAAQAAP